MFLKFFYSNSEQQEQKRWTDGNRMGRRIRTLFGVLAVTIFYFFFSGCSGPRKKDSSVGSPALKSLIAQGRKVAAFRDRGGGHCLCEGIKYRG